MKILLCSVPFRPSIGGIETVSELLARQFQLLGHEVTVATQTPAAALQPDDSATQSFAVLRRPSGAELVNAVHKHDVVLHNQVSLRLGWPLLALRKPWVVAHHTWLPRTGPGAMAARVKRLMLHAARHLAVSDALAKDLQLPCKVVPNPYDHNVFRCDDSVPRQRDLVFVGRLVSDKGVPLLLDALLNLRGRGLHPTVSIIGSGPDEAALRQRVISQGLTPQVMFAGSLRGARLARALQAHKAVVVPSVWEEPFGLVALEGLACGCLPIVAASGGLPEAAGPQSKVFKKGDALALAETLSTWLREPPTEHLSRQPAVLAHLARHHPSAVAQAYLDVLDDARRDTQTLARAA